MNLLCSSDFHGLVPVQMEKIIREKKIDAILYGGDFSPHGWDGEGESTEAPMEFLMGLGLPVFSVFGNIDPDKSFFEEYERSHKNFHFIHLKRVKLKGYYIVGLGDFYFDSYALRTFESLLKQKPEKTIVLSHYPPRGVVDKVDFGAHVGSPELRRMIEKYKPPLFLCGHIHEAAGMGKLGNTQVVNMAMRNILVESDNGELRVSLV
ncbi:MAG: metallophosphoesterase [archaeon]|nr:MAG: metallophosphoesterase [archaeon]